MNNIGGTSVRFVKLRWDGTARTQWSGMSFRVVVRFVCFVKSVSCVSGANV